MRHFIRIPKVQGILFFLLTGLIYLILSRPSSPVTDFAVKGDTVYFTVGVSGMRIAQVSSDDKADLRKAKVLTGYNLSGYARALEVKDQTIYVADERRGLVILEYPDPDHPGRVKLLSIHKTPCRAVDLALYDDKALIACGKGGVITVNIKNPADPQDHEFKIPGNVTRILVQEKRAFVVVNQLTLKVYDLSELKEAKELGKYNAPAAIQDIHLPSGDENHLVLSLGANGLRFLDVSNPGEIREVRKFEAANSAKSFSKLGNFGFIANGQQGLMVVDILENEIRFTKTFPTLARVEKVSIENGKVIFSDSHDGIRILQFLPSPVHEDEQKEKENLKPVSPTGFVNSVARSKGFTLLTMGERGLRVLQGPPQQLQQVAFYDTPGFSQAIATDGDQIYLADGTGGLLVFNFVDPGNGLELLANIETGKEHPLKDVSIANKYLFGILVDGTLKIWDITEPRNPREVVTFGLPGKLNDLEVFGGRAYVAAGNDGLHILDVRDVRFPSVKSHALMVSAQAVALYAINEQMAREQGRDPFDADPYAANTRIYAVVAAADGGLQVLDVTIPEQAEVVGMLKDFEAPVQQLVIRRDSAFVLDQTGQLYLVNLADPHRPVILQRYRLSEKPVNLTVDGTQVYLAAGEDGLRVIELGQPGSERLVGSYQNPMQIADFVRQNDLVYTVGGCQTIRQDGAPRYIGNSPGLSAWRVEAGRKWREIGFQSLPGCPEQVTITGNSAVISAGPFGAFIVDLSDPEHLKLQSSLRPGSPPGSEVHDALVRDRLAYFATGSNGLWVVDISDPGQPKEIGNVPLPKAGSILQLALWENYLVGSAPGFPMMDFWLQTPRFPQYFADYSELTDIRQIRVLGNLIYVAAGKDGLAILNISQPAKITMVNRVPTERAALDLAILDHFAFLLLQDGGLVIYEISDPTQPVELGRIEEVKGLGGLQVESLPLEEKISHKFRLLMIAEDQRLTEYTLKLKSELKVLAWIEGPGTASLASVVNESALFVDEELSRLGQSNPRWLSIRDRLRELAKAWGPRLLGRPWPEIGHSKKAQDTLRQAFVDGAVIGVFGFLFWIVILVQYALPVQSFQQRVSAGFRIFFYLLERHGIAARVRDGEVLQREDNRNRHGFGVVLVDLSSAVILAKRVQPYCILLQLLYEFLGLFLGRTQFGHQIGRVPIRFRGLTLPRELLAYPLSRQNAASRTPGTAPDQGNRTPFGFSRYPPVTRRCVAIPPMRVVGPGLVFTRARMFPLHPRWDEFILGTVDLRNQVRLQSNVVASTRDGIELQTNIFCIFSLGQPPEVLYVTYVGETDLQGRLKPASRRPENLRVVSLRRARVEGSGGQIEYHNLVERISDELDAADREEIHQFLSNRKNHPFRRVRPYDEIPQPFRPPYVVDPERIFSAFAAQSVVGEDGTEAHDWRDLPVLTAVELFRDALSKEKYDYLFHPTDSGQYPLRNFRDQFGRAVRNLGILSYQYVERRDGRPLKEKEDWHPGELIFYPVQPLRNAKVLRARGIRVLRGGFTELRPVQDAVRQQQLATWRARWQRKAEVEQADLDLQAMRIRTEARLQAQRDLINTLSSILVSTRPSDEALTIRVLQALEAAAADPQTRRLLPAETIEMLKNLRNLLR